MKKRIGGLVAAGVLAGMAGCGGGGGGGDGSATPALPQGTGAIAAGVYRDSASTASWATNDWPAGTELIVHPEGRAAGSYVAASSTPDSTGGSTYSQWWVGFAALTTPTANGAASANAPFYAAETRAQTLPGGGSVNQTFTPAYGSADVAMTAGSGGAVRVDLTSVTIATPTRTWNVQRVPAADVATGVTLQRLAGAYDNSPIAVQDRLRGYSQAVAIDGSTGTLQGRYDFDCAINGRVHALDSASAVFRLTATLEGAGCQGKAGTIDLVGYATPRRGYAGEWVLVARGMAANQFIQIVLYGQP